MKSMRRCRGSARGLVRGLVPGLVRGLVLVRGSESSWRPHSREAGVGGAGATEYQRVCRVTSTVEKLHFGNGGQMTGS